MPAETAIDLAPARGKLAAYRNRLRPMIGLVISRCAAVPLQMAGQVVVGALAGPAGLGVLQLFTSWTCFAGEVLAQGLPARAMRTGAIAHHRRDAGAISKELRGSVRAILKLWLMLLGIAGLGSAAWLLGGRTAGSHMIWSVALAASLAAPLFALQRLWSEALKGSGRALTAVSIENLTLPTVLLLATGVAWLVGVTSSRYGLVVPGLGLVGFAISALLLRRATAGYLAPSLADAFPPAKYGRAQPADQAALWAGSVLAILFLQTPFLVLPWFATVAEIGVYAVAFRLVSMITMLLLLQAAVFGPAFARAANQRSTCELRALLRRTQLLSTLIFAFGVLPLLTLSAPLASVFNVPADELHRYLTILAMGQLINAVTGLSGVMLNMAGQARLETITLLAAVLTAFAASPFVGVRFGAEGLAWLFSLCLAGKNIASWLAAKRHITTLEKHFEST